MNVQCYVGDLFLINQQIDLSLVDKSDPFSFKEVREFAEEEYIFVCSYSVFSSGNRALIYRAGKLEANDYLLRAITEGVIDDCNLIIICDEIVKGRKLYNALNKLECIKIYELDAKKFYEIGNSYGLAESVIDAIKLRCGFGRNIVSAKDYVSWCKSIVALGGDESSVLKVVPENRQDSVWVLRDALYAGELSRVMEIADTIVAGKDGSPISIVSAVLYEVRMAYKLSLFKDRRADALAALGKKFSGDRLSCFSPKQLGKVFNILTSAVASMKLGYEPTLLMKNTFVECVDVLYSNGR